MGPGQKFWPGSGQFFVAWAGLGQPFKFRKFPLKMSIFSIFCPSGQKKSLRVKSESTQVKGGLASYLLRVKSKLGLGQGPSLLWRANENPNPCYDRDEILNTHLHLSKEGFGAGLILAPSHLGLTFLKTVYTTKDVHQVAN